MLRPPSPHILLPVLGRIRQADAWNLFVTGLALAVAGVLPLGYARWPLYRQKRFFSFGSRLLDPPHRRCYRVAYVLIVAAVLLLVTPTVRPRPGGSQPKRAGFGVPPSGGAFGSAAVIPPTAFGVAPAQ